jgi:YegS/Rv2252/BmrU family lipid kinase
MKTRFIFNPTSGRRRRTDRIGRMVADFVAARNLDADLFATEGPGHATALARAAVDGGCRRVVAVGGDGTMNEVAQALLRTQVELALVPCGSGNGLARHLGLPDAPARALALSADPDAAVAEIDTGTANGLPFFNAMGLGLDAEVSRRFNALARRGLPAYAKVALQAFLQHRPERCIVDDGRHRVKWEALLVTVANSEQYGNGARIAPGARVDDGLLDLVALPPVGLLGAADLSIRLFRGTLGRRSGILRLRAARFAIERPAPGIVHTDGEPRETGLVVDVAVVPGSLRIVVPAALARQSAALSASQVPAMEAS